MKKQNTLIIVQPFTSDKILYSAIKKRDYKIITLVTPFDKNFIAHCQKSIDHFSDYLMNVEAIAEKDIEKIDALCQQHNLQIIGVINAFDYTLEFSDALAKYFVDVDVDLAFSHIRCDKFLVNQALASAKIRHIRSVLVNPEHSFESQQDALHRLNFPVVVKPASLSASRTHVMLADNFNALAKIVDNIQQAKSLFTNEVITDIVIQEYIEGEEFFVNAVSNAGKHHIAGIFKYKKEHDRFLELWSLDGSETDAVNKLIHYTHECLDGLHVNYGMTHNEFIVDKHGNPYLIEMNNRLAGIEVPQLSQTCYQSNEVFIFLDLLENKKTVSFDLNNIVTHGCITFFSNFTNSQANQLNLTGIHSPHEIIIFRPGKLEPSKDTSLFKKVSAVLWLSNKIKSVLDHDTDLLFSRESNNTLFI